MSKKQYPGNSKYSDVVIGHAKTVEAESTFGKTPGLTVVIFAAMGILLAGGLIAAAWAVVRLMAHA